MDCVNRCIAGRTDKEYNEDNKPQLLENMKQYYEENKLHIFEQHKQYNEKIKKKEKKKNPILPRA